MQYKNHGRVLLFVVLNRRVQSARDAFSEAANQPVSRDRVSGGGVLRTNSQLTAATSAVANRINDPPKFTPVINTAQIPAPNTAKTVPQGRRNIAAPGCLRRKTGKDAHTKP